MPVICNPNILAAVILLYNILWDLEQKYDQRNMWVSYFNDLINPCIAFGLHKASKQILKCSDTLLWCGHGVVSGSFMCHWRAVQGLLYTTDAL